MERKNINILHISNIYFVLAAAVLVITVVYGVVQGRVFALEKAAVADNENTIRQKESVLQDIQRQYSDLASEESEKQEEMLRRIANILPPDENYTELTRQLDRYFLDNDRPGNQILQSSLRFGKGAPVEGTKDISALPFSMNIEATRENFFRFLDYVNSSGSMENGTRLMDIKSIQLNFPEEGENIRNPRQMINFTVDMNAYYHTPKVERQ